MYSVGFTSMIDCIFFSCAVCGQPLIAKIYVCRDGVGILQLKYPGCKYLVFCVMYVNRSKF